MTETLKEYKAADLPKDGSDINIYIGPVNLSDGSEIMAPIYAILRYDQDNFVFKVFKNGLLPNTLKEIGILAEKTVLDFLNEGIYQIK